MFEPINPNAHAHDAKHVQKYDKNASKPAARHFNLPNHSEQYMAVCVHSLHQKLQNSRAKILSSRYQRTFFIQPIYSVVFHVTKHQPIAQLRVSVYKPHTTHNSSIRSDEGLTLETSASLSLLGGQFTSLVNKTILCLSHFGGSLAFCNKRKTM